PPARGVRRTAPLPDRLRRTWRHEPRRAAAPRCAGPHGAAVRAGAGSRAARSPAAAAAEAPAGADRLIQDAPAPGVPAPVRLLAGCRRAPLRCRGGVPTLDPQWEDS